MFDVISIGSALVDIYVQSDDFQLKEDESGRWLCERYDEKIAVDSFQVSTGGGGSNTAVGFARLGLQTAVVSELGVDTWSQLVVADFKQEGVDTSLLIREKKEETGGSVILAAADGGRSIMVHRGAASMLDTKDIPKQVLSQAGWIHLSSIAGRLEALNEIFNIVAQAHRQLSWNPGSDEIKLLVSGQLKLAHVPIAALFVNQGEWDELTPVQGQLQQQANQIVVTNGKKGGVVYQAGQRIMSYQADLAQMVNETGAGDGFATGYVAAIINGLDLAGQVSWGKRNSASVIQQVGAKAGLLTREEMLQ